MPRTATSSIGSKAAGRAIRNARREVGLTQAELGRRLNSSAPYVSELESGKSNLTVGQLWAVADALRVELHIELRVPSGHTAPMIPPAPKRETSIPS